MSRKPYVDSDIRLEDIDPILKRFLDSMRVPIPVSDSLVARRWGLIRKKWRSRVAMAWTVICRYFFIQPVRAVHFRPFLGHEDNGCDY